MKDWLSRYNQNKRKTVVSHITHLICSLVLLLTISLRLIESCSQLASTFHLCLHFHFTFTDCIYSLTETMSKKFLEYSSRNVASGGARGVMAPSLQFLNQARSNSFSRENKRYCFLRVFRNHTDQKFHGFYRVCYNLWKIYGGFSFSSFHFLISGPQLNIITSTLQLLKIFSKVIVASKCGPLASIEKQAVS